MNNSKKKRRKIQFTAFRDDQKAAYQTLKIPLKSILIDHTTMLPVLNDLVTEMNDLVTHTYSFIRLFVLDHYIHDRPFPTLDADFVKYSMKTLGSKSNCGRKIKNTELMNTLQQFYVSDYQPLVSHVKTDLKNKNHLVPLLATQVHTCISNNVQERFIQHLLRFINITTGDITQDKAVLFKFKSQIMFLQNDTDVIFSEWKAKHLQHILPTEIKESIHLDVKIRPMTYLKGMLYMNQQLEIQGSKLFQPLPLRSNIIPKHVTLDTSSLIDLFCPEKDKSGNEMKKGDLFKHIKQCQHDVWSNVLNLQHKIFRNKHFVFHHQIQTDGVSCSLLFIRKDLKDKKWGSKVPTIPPQEFHNIEDLSREHLDNLKDRNVVGCDPGKRSLVFMKDKYGKTLQYTAPQRRIESKAKCNQRILLLEKRRCGIEMLETKLSEQNSKTMDYDKFKTYLAEKDKLNKETLDFYQRDTWRKMKFRQYSYGKKSIDVFLNKIKETFGENVLIGYGNWSRSTQMKHFMPTMNQGLRKLIHKKFDTVTINECNTSKKCCECHKNLKYYKGNYRLLVCSDCVSQKNEKIVFRTRDENSALNIMNITRCWIDKQKRPECFKL